MYIDRYSDGPYKDGRYRPSAPFFAVSLRNLFWVVPSVVGFALALGLLVRVIMVFSQPTPIWSDTKCVAAGIDATKASPVVNVVCGDRTILYKIDALVEDHLSTILNAGRSATCIKKPAILTWVAGATIIECTMNPVEQPS